MAKTHPAIPLAAAGAAVMLLTKKKKRSSGGGSSRFGLHVSSDCRIVTVQDPDLFQRYMVGATRELIDVDQSLTAIQLTDALFGDLAPNCSGFPEQPESAAVVELYAMILRTVTRILAADPRVNVGSDEFIDETTAISFVDWYKEWRNYPSPDVPDVPDGQVAFSSDLSNYQISPTWYEKSVKPFVSGALKSGTADSAYEAFVQSRGVLVGRIVRPIAEMPEDNEVVSKFLDELEESIELAIEELSG